MTGLVKNYTTQKAYVVYNTVSIWVSYTVLCALLTHGLLYPPVLPRQAPVSRFLIALSYVFDY